MRRFAVANSLDRLITLTSTSARAASTLEQLAGAAFSNERRRRGRFPWLLVVESAGRPHAHALVPASRAEAIAGAWKVGHHNVRVIPKVEDQRRAASYLTKEFGRKESRSGHRYRRARGFEPESILVGALTWDRLLDEVCDLLGAAPPDWSSPADDLGRAPVLWQWDAHSKSNES